MSDYDPMDFERNSVGVLVVRVIRVKDIIKALSCTEDFAQAVVREIRGETNADGSLAFVLPSQLARWTYQRAGQPVSPLPFKTMLVKDAERGDALKRAATKADQQRFQPMAGRKSGRKKLVLSKREAARLLGIDRSSTLNELIARGVLKTVLVNGHIKVTRAEVERVAAAGFDVTRPAPVGARRPPRSSASTGESPSREILRIRI